MLVVVLRWQWIAFVCSDFIAAVTASVDTGIRRYFTWLPFLIEIGVAILLKVRSILVKRHFDLPRLEFNKTKNQPRVD